MATALLERDGVLASLDALARRAVTGTGGTLLLEASAGMGKTAILDEVRARTGNARVLTARGVDFERDFPLGVARQLLEPVLRRAAPRERARWLIGSAAIAEAVLSGDAQGATEEGVAFNALYWALAAIVADAPVMLVVDDLHWCDRESLRWIGFVTRRLDDLRLAVVLAARPLELPAAERGLAALRDDPGVQTIGLTPLSADATRTLVSASLGAADDTFIAACHDASGGNPFLLRELLAAARDRSLNPTAANAPRVASLASDGLQRAVLARLGALGHDALAVARATALLGEAAVSLVGAVAGVSGEQAATAAEALQHVELFASGQHLSFRHALLRAAVLAGMSDLEVAAGHLRAARLLNERDAPAEQVAAHLLTCDRVERRVLAETQAAAGRHIGFGATVTGDEAGHRRLICTVIGRKESVCTAQEALSKGTIAARGLVLGGRVDKTPFAITGGTGAYNGARGTVIATDNNNLMKTDVQIMLLP